MYVWVYTYIAMQKKKFKGNANLNCLFSGNEMFFHEVVIFYFLLQMGIT